MSQFAELDDNNLVLRVIVIDAAELAKRPGRWVQTHYDAAQRENPAAFGFNFAGPGMTWDETRSAFIAPRPYPSHVLDEATCQWAAPVPLPARPNDERWQWREDLLQWVQVG